MSDCCCATGSAGVSRCMSAALNLEHCGPAYADQSWCCGGTDEAKVRAVVMANLGVVEQ